MKSFHQEAYFMKVVIVDDDKLVAMSLKTIVESDKDIEVLATGSSGSEAIELFEQHGYTYGRNDRT